LHTLVYRFESIVTKDYRTYWRSEDLAAIIHIQRANPRQTTLSHKLNRFALTSCDNEDVTPTEQEKSMADKLAKASWYAWLPFHDTADPTRMQQTLGNTMPPLLWCIGNFELLLRPAVAIIGTRHPDTFGMDSVRQYATQLAQGGKRVIISGNAMGIDSIAHQSALEAEEGCTIFFFPTAPENARLHFSIPEEVSTRWLGITPFAPATNLIAWNFLKRNELVAAQAQTALIGQTDIKGGTINTLKYLQSYHRTPVILDLPPEAFGATAHQILIKTGKLAHVATTPTSDDIEKLLALTDAKIDNRTEIQQDLYSDFPEDL